ncbi:MAG: hypothetical protein UZ22_OP11002000990 [Microgenomates bacterium OLB23]|nr:MAG: hypothetical protein UZ22_OP11002000990 [Microgenomates bacterium OLB23]
MVIMHGSENRPYLTNSEEERFGTPFDCALVLGVALAALAAFGDKGDQSYVTYAPPTPQPITQELHEGGFNYSGGSAGRPALFE